MKCKSQIQMFDHLGPPECKYIFTFILYSLMF